jgi:hypothetical protein
MRYFRRGLPICPEAMRSWSSSFISGSARCFIITACELLFIHRDSRSELDVPVKYLDTAKTNSSGFPRLQAALYCTESCLEWEQYTFYLAQNWRRSCDYMVAVAKRRQSNMAKTKIRLSQLVTAVH